MKKRIALIAGVVLLVLAALVLGSYWEPHSVMVRAELVGAMSAMLGLLLIRYGKRKSPPNK